MKAKPNTLARASETSLIEAYMAVDAASVAVVCTHEALWSRLQKDKVAIRREMDRRGMQVPYDAIMEASSAARGIIYRFALNASIRDKVPA